MTTTIAPNECSLPEGNYKYQEPLFNNVTGAAITLISVIVHLKWSSVCIVFDNDTEHEAMLLYQGLSDVGIFADVHSLQHMTSEMIDSLMDGKSSVFDETSLNCTILCRLESCLRYLEKPFDYGRKNMVRSSLLHKSKWLLGIFHDCDLSEMETNSSSDLDNVAVIQYPTSLLNKYQQNELNLEDSVRKVFKHMSVLNNSNPETLTEAAIEGLYDWKPFIVHDIKTNNYTGFSIDLLQELAHELNFTYEITSPPDGQWGTETPNGSWTGGAHMADSSSGRTLLSFWWIFCIIMMATYSGNLIAFLTVTKEKLPFTDLSGLVAQDKYQWGIQGGAIFEQIFKTSEIPEYKKIWSGVVEYNKSDTRVLSYIGDEHIGKVLEGNYAFIVDKTFFDMTMIDNCELAMTLAEVLQLQYAMALPNNSPFTKIFTDEIISIHESGLLQIWRLRHWPKPGNCKESILKESNAITLIDVQSAFYLIGIGIFVASCSLCMEFCKHKYCKWRENWKGKRKTSND
ncbi:GRIN [Mytilus edulis]|uniref:GRIN n=1 Tax=Mytilus edulis TaxID=6550 RepID=A0A8S3SLI1_MYTED|nr:GRIN [Mytilus edulis]